MLSLATTILVPFMVWKSKEARKVKARKLMIKLFKRFGDSFTFDIGLFATLQKFVCELYGVKADSTDDARYKKFVGKKKTPEPQQLPPTSDALLCHCKRVSYVTAVAKRSLFAQIIYPGPDGHGWQLSDQSLNIQWMLRKPAPDDILQLLSCNCRKSKCKTQACVCVSHGLQCTDLCGCADVCENVNVPNLQMIVLLNLIQKKIDLVYICNVQ